VVHTAVQSLQDVTSPDWAKRGPDYAATLKIPEPYLRFTVTADVREKTYKNGNTGPAGTGDVRPITAEQVALVKALTERPDFLALMRQVWEAYEKRMEELEAKLIVNAKATS
jgi:hypothetical protein